MKTQTSDTTGTGPLGNRHGLVNPYVYLSINIYIYLDLDLDIQITSNYNIQRTA